MRKKGISGIVASVLLILMAMIIALLIWEFANVFIDKQRGDTVGYSPYYDAKIKLAEGNSSLAVGEGEARIWVERIDNEGNVTGVRLIFEDNKGTSYSYDSAPPNYVGIAKLYTITNDDLDITKDDFDSIQTVSVRLLYGNNKPTSVLDETTIKISST